MRCGRRPTSAPRGLLDALGLFDKGEVGPLEHLARRIPKSVLEQFPNLELERIYGWEADWNFTRSRSGLNRLKRVLHEWRSGQPAGPRSTSTSSTLRRRSPTVK